MRLGVGSYTFVWAVGVPGFSQPAQPMTASTLLKAAQNLGVGVLQIADNLPLDAMSEAEIDELASQSHAAGIVIETGARGIDSEGLHNYVRLSQRLGASILRVVLDTPSHRPSPDEVVATLRGMRAALESSGVCLAVENHDRFHAATLRDIIERIGSDHVGICLDTANSLGCLEGPEAVLEKLGPWTVNLHVKDVRAVRAVHNKGFVIEGCPAGEGQVNIPQILGRLREFGRDPSVILEQWPPPEATIEASVAKEYRWAESGVSYLRKYVSE